MISKIPGWKRNKSKVVQIDQPESPNPPRLIASDEVTKRIIIGIGSRRVAIDFTRRITELPPNAGDQPGMR
jgi:hypothetical protein